MAKATKTVDPNAPKRERKPRTPKGPQLDAADLQRFATYVAEDLQAQRVNPEVELESLDDLFALNRKLKAMTAGGSNVENS